MKVFIMRGISGVGKSTYAKQLATQPENGKTVIVSSDTYMVDATGAYKFDSTKLLENHKRCMKEFIGHILDDDCDTLIVDNTNLHPIDFMPYVRVADAFDVSVMMINMFGLKDVCVKRNIHGLSAFNIERQLRIFGEHVIPPYVKSTNIQAKDAERES